MPQSMDTKARRRDIWLYLAAVLALVDLLTIGVLWYLDSGNNRYEPICIILAAITGIFGIKTVAELGHGQRATTTEETCAPRGEAKTFDWQRIAHIVSVLILAIILFMAVSLYGSRQHVADRNSVPGSGRGNGESNTSVPYSRESDSPVSGRATVRLFIVSPPNGTTVPDHIEFSGGIENRPGVNVPLTLQYQPSPRSMTGAPVGSSNDGDATSWRDVPEISITVDGRTWRTDGEVPVKMLAGGRGSVLFRVVDKMNDRYSSLVKVVPPTGK